MKPMTLFSLFSDTPPPKRVKSSCLFPGDRSQYSVKIIKSDAEFSKHFGQVFKGNTVFASEFRFCKHCFAKWQNNEIPENRVQRYSMNTGSGNLMAHYNSCHKPPEEVSKSGFKDFFKSKRSVPKVFDIVLWSIEKNISLSAIYCERFNKIVQSVPSRSTLMKQYVRILAESTKQSLKDELQSLCLDVVVISLDSWTDNYRRNGYTAVLIHFLDAEFKYQVVSYKFVCLSILFFNYVLFYYSGTS